MTFVLGKKLSMSQIWKEKKMVPVTVITVLPTTISLMRTKERDGYAAVQVKAGRVRREARHGAAEAPGVVGDAITASAFKEGDRVRITGVSKGRGFQGVVKRHGFHGGPQTHGQKNRLRAPGSIGSTAPQRVVPGRKMAGRMGTDRVTLKSLEVVGVDAEKNLLMVKGAVPGAPGGIIEITKLEIPARS